VKINELGEFGLIDLIAGKVKRSRKYQPAAWQGVKIGIGDDAAVWQGADSIELATTDTLVQDVHFSLKTTTWEELGWKSLAVNISDIGAMGGVPKYALVTLALPGDVLVEDIVKLYNGMLQACKKYRVAIVGGDMVTAACTMITVALWGCLNGSDPLTRSAARPGDIIAVTGFLGDSAGGLALMTGDKKVDASLIKYLRTAHLHPEPRVKEGQFLARIGVKAAIDISDGLVADLGHICQSSKVSAIINTDKLPISPRLKQVFGERALPLALFGGEDYELLFTAPATVMETVKKEITCPITVIGEITSGKPEKVTLMDGRGKALYWERGGWDHFLSSH